jgi:TolB-like protein/tRNA A-37 threonylcarbamoyl transferase component Bud32
MGEVYKARDTRLDRIVAIKRLKGEHTARFEQEARAIAALNHPHICTLHDIGPDYLVMEYVEGAPLKGPLRLEEALRLAVQIAEALVAAHAKGILHRDLKPGNVLVTGSGAKLLDFGLAKLTADEGTDRTQTIDGTVLGTAAYMSPEQAQGQTLDARSDIFSFGALFYEMLSGKRAFTGESMLHTLNAVVHGEPALLQSPAAEIVKRCMAKQPAQRFQSMAEVRAALQQVMVKPLVSAPSIAVLPFANMSRDADDEYFSDGLAEEIINLLAQVAGLKVIARTSAFAFKGKNEDIRKIAETLGVSNVLEGSVRRAGTRLRVTAQLIQAQDGMHLWSQRYDREMTDVFAVQDEIAAAIAEALQVKLDVAPAELRRYTPNLPAYEAFLKARYYWPKITPESLARSKEYYEQAIALDPGFALAHVGLADYFLLMTAGAGIMPAHQAMPLVRAGAQKALDLDPSLPDAHAMLGIVAGVYDYDWKEAERLFRLAMTRDPVPPQVHAWYGYFYLLPMGRAEDAVEAIERGLQEDPLHLLFRVLLAFSMEAAGRYEDGATEFRRILELDENYWAAYSMLAWNHALRGMFPEALPLAEKGYSLAPWNVAAIAAFAAVLQRTGNTSRAEEVLQPLRSAPEAYAAPRGLAFFHLLCGEIDQAADWVEKCVEQRDPYSTNNFNFRLGARWPALAKMMNLPETGHNI